MAITTEYAKCPWNDQHNLLMIGLKGEDLNRKLNFEELPPNNLNFLIDVSGSMGYGEKLPLVKSSLKKLVDKLRPEDKVSIVVYAGAAGIVLPPTSGNQKTEIVEALDRLSAGGSTAGGEGIKLAYKVAKENFIKNGNNRIIICTDGDFNVGPSSDTDMEQLVNGYKDSGIYITCLGFGMGNYKDSKMEAIAESGEGNYAYIDSQNEADYVFGSGLTGTLYTIAKDVKIQVEFNPEVVKGYRLIGYENRMLIPEDFMNDQVDARDLGSGHTVTALYEIIPVGDTSDLLKPVAPLRYQSAVLTDSQITDEVGTVKFRYKLPQTKVSTEVVNLVKNELSVNPGRNFRLSTAVAEYGLLLRRSKHKAAANYESILSRVENAYIQTENQQPWEEFIRLAQNAQSVKPLY
ncbi:MAG: YfbK domain-containing protein [Bacteroidota bacterium]